MIERIEIATVAVVGTGAVGRKISMHYAAEGTRVLLLDPDDEALRRGMERIHQDIHNGLGQHRIHEARGRAILDGIRAATDWSELTGIDLVIEALEPAGHDVNRAPAIGTAALAALYRRLADAARPDTVLATNGVWARVAEIAAVAPGPERVLGLHHVHLPGGGRLVEVVPGPQTGPEPLEAVWQFEERGAHVPIGAQDEPGFVFDRLFIPWVNEAVRMLEEGEADLPSIEAAAREAFGGGIGPFHLLNLVGSRAVAARGLRLAESFGEMYRPPAALLEDPDAKGRFDLADEPDPDEVPDIRERLQGVAFHVAARMWAEGIGAPEDVDLAMRVALHWKRGPYETMNRLGSDESRRLAQDAEERYGLTPPRHPEESAAVLETEMDEPFEIRLVRPTSRDHAMTLALYRPDSMNTLTPEVFDQLRRRLKELEADNSVRGIVLTGSANVFSAGLDLEYLQHCMHLKAWDRIRSFIEDARGVLRMIETYPKPIVARLQGPAFGAGLELALACDQIIGCEHASIALPETGMGIVPVLGGSQRASRRAGVPFARWMVLTGAVLDAVRALRIGIIDRVVPAHELDAAALDAVEEGKQAGRRQGPARPDLPPLAVPDPALAALAEYFEFAVLEEILDDRDSRKGPHRAEIEEARGRILARAPRALDRADALLMVGGRMPLEEALEREMWHIEEIFKTEDAVEGLKSMGAGTPEFRGR